MERTKIGTQTSTVTASLVTYFIYKRWEPQRLLAHAVLLVLLPAFVVLRDESSMISLKDVCVRTMIHWVIVVGMTTLYRLSRFHPLAEYPGPLVCKITKFSLAYATSRGRLHEVVRQIHAQYGDVVRIGPNELSFCRSDAVQPVLGARLLQRGPYFDTRRLPSGRYMIDGVRDFAESAVRRKQWLKAMSGEGLKGCEDALASKIRELCENLKRRQEEAVDISAWMSYFGFDFMGVMALGRDFGMMKAGADVDEFWRLIEKGSTMNSALAHIPWILPIIYKIPDGGKDVVKLRNICAECAASRVKQPAKTKDLFYYLSGENESPMADSPDDHLIENGITAVVAGSDTAATALAHLCYFLVKHPECYQKLRKEINEYFPSGGEVFDPRLHVDMPYLNACINEVMRLYAPVMTGLQRRVEYGTGGMMISGYFVPEDTQVSVHTHTLHRHPQEFFPLPDVFWPDRWLDQDVYTLPTGDIIPKEQIKTTGAALIPFSVGPQSCVGKSLAMMEIRATLCALVQKFEMRAAEGFRMESWEENLEDIFVTKRGPLLIRVKEH
ncbi:hypothetical protein NM688_g4850 [Phlebia brevispora]|uniref:Uncharacterized protein n=1 Tax=Phlebia brevispora TaxID=194682 RepID=A0ACC1T1Y6_9APHY|nr:hypothetical protein NM688_g4850 [Phlebia brevispora]